MAGLSILKQTYDLSDEQVCERSWRSRISNIFVARSSSVTILLLDRSSLTRSRQRIPAPSPDAIAAAIDAVYLGLPGGGCGDTGVFTVSCGIAGRVLVLTSGGELLGVGTGSLGGP
jgi:hypothetical protein